MAHALLFSLAEATPVYRKGKSNVQQSVAGQSFDKEKIK
jgi:hypothetical protein